MYRNRMPAWKKKLAKELRKNPTRAEDRLWQIVRGKKINGLRFRRQSPMLGYIADFYCPALKLVVEVDGAVHKKTMLRDYERDVHMRDAGLRVLRVTNSQVFYEIDRVIGKIMDFTERKP